ncbi:hypothetical protein FB45DRAFT_1060346 [Roridomyces roridus]|uniref:F-box domain-containing protein n=1 Tax=Roridomyces roridus TaxID=1738132 RepID=A0AAD7FLE4_9AGAR|nr:hypothetical protein FB45DRAFT_1060346 [Roridomyces roridus]
MTKYALSPVPWTEPKDYASLSACALVSRSFREPFQRQLFRSLTFLYENGQLGVEGFLELSFSNARLATYIHALHLCDVSFFREDQRAPLEKFFPLLKDLTHLGLAFMYVDMGWVACPAAFRAIVVDLLSLPSLKFLALHNCRGVPSSIIRHALLSYEQVSLMNVGIAGEEGEEVFPYQRRGTASPLCRLFVRYTQMTSMAVPVNALILTAASAGSFNLRQFEITAFDSTTDTFGDSEPLVESCSLSLEHLMLHFQYPRAKNFDKSLPLPSTPNLRIRTLTISSKNCIGICILRTLARLPASLPNIEQINILLEHPSQDYLTASGKAELSALYDQVDGILVNLARLCELHICWIQDAQVSSRGVGATTAARLPLVHGAGKLKFSSKETGWIMESPFFRPHLPGAAK